MSDLELKKSYKSILKNDFLQEILFSVLGALSFFLFLFIVPQRLFFIRGRSRDYSKILLSMFVLIFFFIFLLINQKSAKIKFLEVSYKRNIIIFSIFNFSIHLILFFFTKFGLYLFTSTNLKFFLIESYSNFRPFYFFNYYFLLFYSLLPILLYEFWKRIYDEKTSFIISVVSTIFIIKPFYIDILISFFFIIPFIFYYIENIKKKEFRKKDYIIAGILGSIIICCFYISILILIIYLVIRIIVNHKDFKENYRQTIIILGLALVFSSWLIILLIFNVIFSAKGINQSITLKNILTEFFYFFETSLISFSGFFFIIGIIYILKKYKVSQELKILGNLLISVLVFFLISLIGTILNIFFFQFHYLQFLLYITIITFSLFYIQFFYLLTHRKIFKNSDFKGNFHHVELSLIIIIFFSQAYFNLDNIYNSEYFDLAIKRENPDDVIDCFYDYEYKEYYSLPLERLSELCLKYSINSFFSNILNYLFINFNIAEKINDGYKLILCFFVYNK